MCSGPFLLYGGVAPAWAQAWPFDTLLATPPLPMAMPRDWQSPVTGTPNEKERHDMNALITLVVVMVWLIDQLTSRANTRKSDFAWIHQFFSNMN